MKANDILNKDLLTKDDLIYLLSTEIKEEIELLYNKAYETKVKYIGKKAFYRGLIEFSNECIKNCLYCGIRKDNDKVERFFMSKEDILEGAKWIYENNYGSIVLQAGEKIDSKYVDFVEDILKEIKKLSNNELGITISLGEQSYETYKRWFDAGAHRYLLRIESSNKTLYDQIHPNNPLHDYSKRLKSLNDLRKIGYQVGTGVMIGLPGQTIEDLANDLLFYKKIDIDMIGMGPYIPHKDSPMSKNSETALLPKEKRVELGLKMIALARILLKDVNIAATTALQGLDPLGREKGLKAGANILMPITTPGEHKAKYQLYDGKPCIDDSADQCKKCLQGRVGSVGDEVIYGEWGDSPHFTKRKGNID